MKNHSKAVCLICEEKVNLILLHKTNRYSHKLCLGCLETYLQPYLKIFYDNYKTKKKIIFSCCGDYHCRKNNECKQQIDFSTLILPNNSNLYTDLIKIQVLTYKHSSLCPCCKNVIIIPPRYKGKINCQCQNSYCSVCSFTPYHDRKNCAENMLHSSSHPDVKFIGELISKNLVKLCPCCSYPIEKYDGCNKMHCQHCDSSWCWLCSKIISDYKHFSSGDCKNKLWLINN